MDDVHPILAEHCFSCHAGAKRKGGLSMDSRASLLEGSETGPVLHPGNAADSLLMNLVQSPDPDERMPPKGRPLLPEEIAVLTAWINEGVTWEDVAVDQAAYMPSLGLVAADAPNVPADTLPANMIDQHVFAYMLERDVPLPDTVDDRRFLRRAFLDVTGLLPTLEERDHFLADASPDKRAELIDNLLARDQAYAEHWISLWNDLLRNDFEGTGYIDGGRRQITDWLYNALLTNMPYDEFAADLIAPRGVGSEGFINGIVWRGDSTAVQQPAMQAARNVAEVFTGINMKCASCHDSFVDHWSLSDSYALANAFSEEPMELVRCDLSLGVKATYGYLWPELGTVDGTLTRRKRMDQISKLVTSPDNGFFSRTIVNRIWARLLGHGIVEPLNALEREPWNAPLLDALAQTFQDNGYDMRALVRLIMNSRVYQWPAVDPADDDGDTYVFRGPAVRRISSEQYYDALSTLTGIWQINPKFVLPQDRTPEYAAEQERLAKLAAGGQSDDGTISPGNLEARRQVIRAWRVSADPLTRALGRNNREQVTARRENDPTTLQSLELSNGETLTAFIRVGAKNLIETGADDPAALAQHLFAQGLQRVPTENETAIAVDLIGSPPTVEGIEDFLWALSMLPEFQLLY